MKKKLFIFLSVICLAFFCLNFANDSKIINNTFAYQESFEDVNFESKTLLITGNFNSSKYKDVTVLFDGTTIIKFETYEETKQAYIELKQNPNLIIVVEESTTISLTASYPPYTAKIDWGYTAISANTYNEYLEHYNVANKEEAVVVVVDTGINTSHELLKNRILKDDYGNYVGKAATNAGSKIETKYTYSGYEFEDDNGHGTHIAGIICNSTPSNVKILPIKFIPYSKEFSINSTDIATLFSTIGEYAKDYNIVAVNMSWGSYDWGTSLQTILTNAINTNLIANNIVPLAAAGNDKKDSTTHFPSCLENVICVSALKQDGTSATFDSSYSNFGDVVDISAPGTNIYSSYISSTNSAGATKYTYLEGTSMATPYAAAVVTLLYLNPTDSNTKTFTYLRDRLYDLSIDLGDPNVDEKYGHGMVSLEKALGTINYSVTNKTVTYNGNYHNIAVSVTNVTDYTITYGFSSTSYSITNITTNDTFKNYTNGQKTIYFKITAQYYNDTYGYGYLTINKANVAIKILNQTHTYGNEVSLNNSLYSISSGTLYGTDDLGVTLNTTATKTSSAGSYDITASASNNNYNLSYTQGTLVISSRPISITLSNQTSEYGDNIVLNDTSYTVTSAIGIANNDNLNLVLSTNATSSSPVGNYTITLKGYNSNYSITAIQGTYIITQKTLTLSSSQSGSYGDAPSLNQTNYSCNVELDASVTITLTTNATNLSPVGSYKIYFACNNTNYKISDSSTGTYSVYKRTVAISANKQTSTYGDNVVLEQTAYSITTGSIVNDDEIIVALSTTATNTSPVGTYSIIVNCSGVDSNNYNFITNSNVLSITKRSITVTADEQTSMYGNTISLDNSKFTVNNLANDDVLKPTLTTSANNKSNVGDYDIVISCSSSNYDITLENGTLKITPRKITITISNQSGTYGESINLAKNYSVTSSTKIVNNDNLNIVLTTTATNTSPVGTYPITLTYTNDNYDVEIVEGTFTILQRTLIITIENQSITYGDEIILDQTKFSINLQSIDKTTLGLTLSTTATKTSPVGTYPITATLTSSNFTTSINEGTLTITKRELGITINNQTNTYGYINLIQSSYTLSNVVNNDIVSINLSTTATNTSPIGSYSITASTTNENYLLPEISGILIIEAKEIEIVLNNQNGGYYGAISLNQNDYYLMEEPINNDRLNISLSTTATNTSTVGTYPITYSWNNSNYSIVGDDAIFTVNARPIEITINQTSVYGDEITLDTSDYVVTSTIKLINGDNLNLNLATTANSLSSPGKYDISATNNNNNYSVTFVSATLTITKRPITITALEVQATFTYGEEISLNQSRYEISNLMNEDEITVTLTTTATSASNVGTYPVTPSYESSLDSEKYAITIVSSSLTISPRTIEVTIANQESYYGAEINLEPLYSITSTTKIVNGDNLNIILTTTANKTSDIGTYPISLTYSNDNYIVDVIEGTLEIKQCDMIITIQTQFGVYGDDINLDQNAYTISTDIDKSILGITLSTNATKTSPVGNNYEITLNYTNTNFSIVVKKASFEITPRPITINISDQTNVYGEINLNQNLYTTSEQPLSEAFGIVLTTEALATSASGSTYEINFTYSNKNYAITASNLGTLTITPRTIEIATYQYSSYGNDVLIDNDNYDITSGNVINEDTLNLNMTCSATSSTSAGQYPISITCGNANYTLTTKAAIYEILPRPISISISQQNPYGNQIALDSDDYQINAGNLVNNDNLNLVLSTTALYTDDVNTYPITIEDSNPNYNISLLQGEFVITKRQITISSIQTAEYGQVVLNDDNYLILKGSKAFETDELNISFSTIATNKSNAGTYNLTLTYNNTNYNILLDESNSKLVVQPKNITVKLNDSQSVYGEPVVINNTYQVISGSIINNDNLNIELTTRATSTSNVGSYYITSSSNNPNYKITLINNYHTITKRKITVKLQNQTTPHGLMYDIDQTKYEIVSGTILENTNLDLEIYSNGKQFAFMGKYDLMAKTSNENYEIEIIGAKLTITPSLEDAAIVAIVVIIGVSITVTVIKRSRKKKKNQELFDKYIGW